METLTTGEDGTAKSGLLYLGRYRLEERQAPSGCVLNPQPATYLPFEISCQQVSVRDKRTLPLISATASKNKDGKIHISLSNVDVDNEQEVIVNLPGIQATKAAGEMLTSAQVTDYNSFENPDKVKLVPFKEVKINKGILKIKLPAKSIVTVELQ